MSKTGRAIFKDPHKNRNHARIMIGVLLQATQDISENCWPLRP